MVREAECALSLHSSNETELLQWLAMMVEEAEGFPYSLPSVWPGADPGVQAVNPQAWRIYIIHPAVGCHYYPPGLRLPSQPHSITAPRPVPSYTAWWQRHIGVNNLPKVVTQLLPRVGFEPTTCWLQVQRSTCCATVPWWQHHKHHAGYYHRY